MKRKTPSRTEPWFAEGLRFGCRRCGTCCTGEPGYVFLRRGEAGALASFLSLGEREFRLAFTRKAGRRTSLKEEGDGRCVFYDEGCRVYPVRPVQCRIFPFWLRILSRRENWEAEALLCPGMGRGRLYSREELEELLGLGID